MRVEFYQDPETGEPHLWKHGVSEEEASQVVEAPGELRLGERRSMVALGQSAAGRYLKVIYRQVDAETIIVITAFDLVGKPRRAYERRMKRKR
ncbi:MAG TPA: hypothetical protein PLX06_02595 [Fimbriimonadaceae bacterium]|nr:hypothetical protein [Fimbriimonadaceae bacterium]